MSSEKKMQTLLLVANGMSPPPSLLQKIAENCDGVVAVDGGLIACDAADIQPLLILGDMDSAPSYLLKKYEKVSQVALSDQNKSDLEKAIDYLYPFDRLIICGALGKRIDHTLTNICLLSRHPGKIIFESEEERCFALEKQNVLQCRPGQTVSLIPLSTEVKGVTTQGLKWELKEAALSKSSVSISNVCLQDEVLISFTIGDLLVALNTL